MSNLAVSCCPLQDNDYLDPKRFGSRRLLRRCAVVVYEGSGDATLPSVESIFSECDS